MKNRSLFSVYKDGEIPETYTESVRRKLETEAGYAEFESLANQVGQKLRADPEPDFESRKAVSFSHLQQKIRERNVQIRPITVFQRSIKTAWAAAAVFAALAGGWLLGRTTAADTQMASAQTPQDIVFSLPEGFDLEPAGQPEMVRLSSYRSEP